MVLVSTFGHICKVRSNNPLLATFTALLLSGCGLSMKSVVYLKPDLKDHDRMRNLEVKAPEEPFCFMQYENDDFGERVKVNDWSPAVVPVWRSLNELVDAHPNQALVVIRNDSILYQHYDREENFRLHPSYSVAKSFTSALVGFAIQDGSITSMDELVSDHLPNWSDDPRYAKVKLKHLLNHTSGIEHGLKTDGLLYYGSNLERAKTLIKFVREPGKYQAYMNMNIWLLGQVIEKVSGKPLSSYLEEKIWVPLGMERNAKWSADKHDRVKGYCCLQATALDYARFARLYLNLGKWEGKQLLNKEWIKTTLSRDTTEGGTNGYRNSWYIGYKEYNDYMAIGLYKQHIYINLDKNIIIVSMNGRPKSKAEKALNWEDVFRQIVDQL